MWVHIIALLINKNIYLNDIMVVLSGESELVSVYPIKREFARNKAGATQQERRHG
jgi:hypothetical protein